MGTRGRRTVSDPAVDVDEAPPVKPERVRPTATMDRAERMELRLGYIEEDLDNVKELLGKVLAALEGRTRVSEKCIGLLQGVVAGVLNPSRGFVILCVLVAAVAAPASVLAVLDSKTSGRIVAMFLGAPVAEAAPDPEPDDEVLDAGDP
jgi:hypothetical protein